MPLAILGKLMHLKIMLLQILLGLGAIQTTLIAGGALLYYYLKYNTICRFEPHVLHTHSHVTDAMPGKRVEMTPTGQEFMFRLLRAGIVIALMVLYSFKQKSVTRLMQRTRPGAEAAAAVAVAVSATAWCPPRMRTVVTMQSAIRAVPFTTRAGTVCTSGRSTWTT